MRGMSFGAAWSAWCLTLGMASSGTLHAQTPKPASTFTVTYLHRLTASPGVRETPAVAVTTGGYVVFWSEAPDLLYGTSLAKRYRIFRLDADSNWSTEQAATPFISDWGNQWGPAVAADGRRTYLSYYFADPSMPTGARDLGLRVFDGRLTGRGDEKRLTRSPASDRVPINHASPTIMIDSDRVIVANSWGAYHGDRPVAEAYDDKNIEVRTLASNGELGAARDLTTSAERGREITPSLVLWPGPEGNRYVMVYASQEGSSPGSSFTYDVYLKVFDRGWHELLKRRVTRSANGRYKPSLLAFRTSLLLSYTDEATGDVQVARLNARYMIEKPASLRAGLLKRDFASYGQPYANLSGATLFNDRGRLGVVFIATMHYDEAAHTTQQDVFVAELNGH